MTTLTAIAMVSRYVKANWRRFTRAEAVLALSLFAMAVLQLLVLLSPELRSNTTQVLASLSLSLLLGCASALSILTALVRISEHDMTAKYLDQYSGDHLMITETGDRYWFVPGRGWEREVQETG